MGIKKIAYVAIALAVVCISSSITAWCDENQALSQKAQEQSDRANPNPAPDTLAIKDSMGKTLAIIQKGDMGRNLLNQHANVSPANVVKLPKRYDSSLASQRLLSSLAASRKLQQINTGVMAPGGFTPTAAFDTAPEKQSAS